MSLLTYYLQVNIGLIAVTIGYLLLLNKEIHFNYNRTYLLVGIFSALIFPLITIKNDVVFFPSGGESLTTYLLPEFIVDGNVRHTGTWMSVRAWSIIQALYFTVTAGLLINLIYKIYQLLVQSKKATTLTHLWNFKVIQSLEGFRSFSFFHLIFIGDSYTSEEREQVIAHEMVHARSFHSIDILLAELLKTFFWFNPAVYLFKKLFTLLHEFQADRAAVEKCDVEQYCNLLARVALQSADYPIANHFNNSLTFKRISMIKNATGRLNGWRVISSLLIILGLFIFVSCKEENKSAEKISPSDEVFNVVDESAAPAEGMTEFYEYIGNRLVYPKQARQMGVEGKVFVEFIVNKDGSISDVTVTKGIGAGCDKAAIEVVSASPKWKPGKQAGLIVRQRFTVPIQFKLG
jgi:TonB family protein